jgi:hypothetical protein
MHEFCVGAVVLLLWSCYCDGLAVHVWDMSFECSLDITCYYLCMISNVKWSCMRVSSVHAL